MRFISEVREGLAIAWAAIRSNKLRSGLTTLGVVIGIVTVTLMGTAIQAIDSSFHRSIGQLGADVLYVVKFPPFEEQEWWRVRNRRDITLQHVKAIERQATLAQLVVPETYTESTLRRNARSARGVTIVGTTENNFLARNFSIARGRFFSPSEVEGGRPVCVLGADIATKFFPNEPALRQKIWIGGRGFEVIGVMAPFDKFLGMGSDNHVLIPVTQFTAHFDNQPDVTILVKVLDLEKTEDAREEVRGIMRKVRGLAPGKPDDFGIMQQDMFLQFFARVGGSLATAGLFITGLSLFVGGIGIMNIMFVSVAERTREIGVRKAIGAKRRTILVQFLIEAAAICLLGGLIGLAIAFPVTFALPKSLAATLSPSVVGIALLVSIITGVASGFLPAWRASKMNPVDALRSE
ncbi:MAG: ABC transporter permease [Verrucomicrobiales bacterium]|nr:ABC transporter permease [Verrucomicrobiales bacterium]